MSAAPAPIHCSTLVRSGQEHTFGVFVNSIGAWWPVRPYSLGHQCVRDVTFTPELGGRVYETRDDGSTATWGHVVAWDPPFRFTMTWEVFAGGTELEVTFRPLGPALTRVELEHRGWERLSEQQVRTATAAAGGYRAGWAAILTALTTAAEHHAAPSQPHRTLARQRRRSTMTTPVTHHRPAQATALTAVSEPFAPDALTPEQALDRYRAAMAVLDGVVDRVPTDRWLQPSPCPDWTARDIVGHLVWGQRLLAAWASNTAPPVPASPPSGELGEDAPAAVWHLARRRTTPLLTSTALQSTVTSRAFGPLRLATFLATFPFDALTHAWDLATTTGQQVQLPESLLAEMLSWANSAESLLRRPGGLGAARTAPAGAPLLERFLAFTGREPARPHA